MPLITSLEPEPGRGACFLLEVDGEAVGRVPPYVVASHGLTQGRVLSPETVSRVVMEAARSIGLEAALRYLSYRPRTRSEVMRHLISRGHGIVAERVVERCRELGYLDDATYSVAFARERIRLKPRGRARIVSELLKRGVDRGTAENAVAVALAEEEVTETDLLHAVAQRRASSLGRLDPATARRRLYAYLIRRGFMGNEVQVAVDRVLPEESSPASS